jgi:uncharacterized protein YndB with AHSA1/START domain
MSVISVEKNPESLTLTMVAEFPATLSNVWQMWQNPRMLERWWGPPTYPATFVDHELVPGGRMSYYMTSPEGEKYHGWWRIVSVDEPRGLVFEDGFADDSGAPNETMPVTSTRVSIEEAGAGTTRMTLVGTFPSLEAMEQLVAMGMVEGLTEAVSQIDALLAEISPVSS